MAETHINRRPVRASFYGVLWGLSLFVLLVWESIILLDSLGGVIVKGILIVVAAVALSLVWAYFGPAKRPKGPRPAAAGEPPPTFAEAATATAFDEPPADEAETTPADFAETNTDLQPPDDRP